MNNKPASGWDSIDDALRALYGDREPRHYGTVVKRALGGPDPIDGISAYKNEGAVCHWHFITYGFTDLYEKETEDPDVSGFGFELTFRLACKPEGAEPPRWALNFLQNLARYVFESGNAFGAGHHMNLNGPISLDEPTEIGAIAFAADPQLPEQSIPNGRMKFIRIVGLTLDEYHATKDWNTLGFLNVLATGNPLLITDLQRGSILRDPQMAATIRDRTDREGSSTGSTFIKTLTWVKKGLFKRTTR